MVSKHDKFHLIRSLCINGSPVTQLNKSFIKSYTKDVLMSNQLSSSYLINGDFAITIKRYQNMPKVNNIMLIM